MKISQQNIKSKWVLFFLIVALVIPLTLVSAADNEGSGRQNGFTAVNGTAAEAYRAPDDVTLTRDEALANYGLSVSRYQQMYGKAEVFGAQTTVISDEAGKQVAVIGTYYSDIEATNQVELSAKEASAVALTNQVDVARSDQGTVTTDLMIDAKSGRYFYVVENQKFSSRWFYWVDAESGLIINSYNGLTTGDGIGVLGDTKDLTDLTTQSDGIYQMVSTDGRQTTYDARNRNRLPGSLATDSDDTWNTAGRTSPGQPALVDAHFYGRVTDDYYLTTHGFNWTSAYPQGIVSSAHLQKNYSNAYWNGSQMAYGDGDGTEFRELSGDLDVVGHELSHGVTEATSNLIYQNESGALNEAFSDMMGTSIEFANNSGNWTIGEDIDLLGNGFRNMADPGEDGDPSHYAERYTGTGDNGGVHINSGIANHWFYLLVNGGQNANATYASGSNVQGIGLASAEGVVYLGFTALSSGANFCDARAATIAVAGNNAANVGDAWDEVGVDETLCGGSTGGGALNVTVTTDQSSYSLNQPVTITVHVEDDNSANVQGATASVSIVTPKGQTYTGSTSTNASGNAVFTFTPRRQNGSGTYDVSATGSASGYTSGSGNTSFTAN